MKVISIVNNKGGVGKTTTAFNLASGLTHRGYSVGMIDFDSQANLTLTIKAKEHKIDLRTAIEARKRLSREDFTETDNRYLYILPNYKDTNSRMFNSFEAYEQTSALKNVISDEFDFIIIDTPPTLDIQMYNAIVASDFLLIPVEYDVYSISGLGEMFQKISQLKEGGHSKAEILGILVTKVDNRQSLNKLIDEHLNKSYSNYLFETFIRVNSEYRKSQAAKQDSWGFGDKKGSEDYDNLINEILHKITK